MTKRKRLHDRQRPRRLLGEKLREFVHCPFCYHGHWRVVRYREATVRFECQCGTRWTLDLPSLVQTLHAFNLSEDADEIDVARQLHAGNRGKPLRLPPPERMRMYREQREQRERVEREQWERWRPYIQKRRPPAGP